MAEISPAADVLVMAGDLTDLGKPKEAELLAAKLRSCTIPIVAVLGNHDRESGMVDEVSAVLIDACVKLLNGQPVEIDGAAFVGVKGFAGGLGRHMLGSSGGAAIKAMVAESVEESMRLKTPCVASDQTARWWFCSMPRLSGPWRANPRKSIPFWARPGWPKPLTASMSRPSGPQPLQSNAYCSREMFVDGSFEEFSLGKRLRLSAKARQFRSLSSSPHD